MTRSRAALIVISGLLLAVFAATIIGTLLSLGSKVDALQRDKHDSDQAVEQLRQQLLSHNITPQVSAPASAPQRGQAGPSGMPGPQGSPGVNGANGKNGLNGAPGATGRQGADGTPGPAGSPGTQGEPGPAGSPGAQGAQGEPGPSASPQPDPCPTYRPDPTDPTVLECVSPSPSPAGSP